MPKISDNQFYGSLVTDISKRSYSKRKQVGALAVRDNDIIAYGFNGTPKGFDNCCEDENNVTKPEVLHAELNLICKCAKSGKSLDGASLYITLSPCIDCAKLIVQCGIKEVFYIEEYRNIEGIEFLKKNNIPIMQFKLSIVDII